MKLYKMLKNTLKLGKWCENPAKRIDDLYQQSTRTFFEKVNVFMQVRIICTFGFLPDALADAVTNSLMACALKVSQLFAANSNKGIYRKRSAQRLQLAVKNLWALSGFLFALLNPKLVAFYFIPKREKYGAMLSGGHLFSVHPEIQYPENKKTLQTLIAKANRTGKKVTVVGAGRSQGQQFLPSGDAGLVINMQYFNQVNVNPKTKTVLVGAGATWGEIQKEANKHSLAIKVMQASNVFSIGGSLSTNIHGWNKEGTVAKTIKSLTIINAQGKLQKLKPSDELFGYVLGGFNQFGVIVNAEIALTDNEVLVEKSVAVKPDNYVDYFKKSVVNNDTNKMHLYRLSIAPKQMLQEGVAVNYITTNKKNVKSTENFHLEPASGTRFERIFLNFARRFAWLRGFLWSYEKKRLLKHETKLTTNEIMQPAINAMFNHAISESEWLQEFFLPGDKLSSFLNELGQLLTQNQVNLLNATVRYVKQDNISKMSYAKNGDRFAVVLCFNQSLKAEEILKTKKWVRKAIDLSLAKGGTYYLPYQPFATQEQFAKAYPTAKTVLEKKKKVDPKNTFSSGFSEQYLLPAKKEHSPYKGLLATQAKKEKFGRFLDNILVRVDKEKLFPLLEDILSYCDTNKEVYTELSNRISEIMPNKLTSGYRIMRSLSEIKKDLSEQALQLMADDKTKPMNGLIEIGFPGRFITSLRRKLPIRGEMTVLNDVEAMSDVIQSGFPRPYHRFVPLNDYAPLAKKQFADNSVDMVTCFIGLHHVPDNKIEEFIASLNRVLRPGGSFLLVDHDIRNEETREMASLAHSIYNAVMGVPVAEEMNEIRNFRSLQHWQDLLAKHGFEMKVSTPKKMVRAGDPTENTMVRFVKKEVVHPKASLPVKQRTTAVVTPLFAHKNQNCQKRQRQESVHEQTKKFRCR